MTLKCEYCKKELNKEEVFETTREIVEIKNGEKIITEIKMSFCREHFSYSTIIIGLMNYKQNYPEFISPLLPEFDKDISFDEMKELYNKYMRYDNYKRKI